MEKRNKNYAKLAKQLGVRTDANGKINEDDLRIARLDFYYIDDVFAESVEADPMNLGGRLFFQQFTDQGLAEVELHAMFRIMAKEFFAEAWTDKPNKDQKILFGIRTFASVKFVLK